MSQTKICTCCGQEKPIEEFAYRNKKKGTRRAECKQCISARQKKKYQKNKAYINDLKSQTGCAKCGDTRFYVLEYHHLDPTVKLERISKLSTHSSFNTTEQEITKCICLCSNCHREFHYLQRLNNITIDKYINNTAD